MAAIFTAFDITGISTNVSTSLVAGVGILLIFMGYKFVKRIGRSL